MLTKRRFAERNLELAKAFWMHFESRLPQFWR
jgi:hypothetical protein